MEMTKVVTKKSKQLKKKRTANKAMQEVNDEGNPYALVEGPYEEADGSSHYSALQKPPEDIYSSISETAKKAQDTAKCYRVICLILSMLCLILLAAIVVIVKICPVNQVRWVPERCNKEQCSTFTPQDEHRCNCCFICPIGWTRVDQSCFFFSTFTLSWDKSGTHCLEQGGSLALIDNDEVQNFLTQRGNGLKYWIGLGPQGSMTPSYWSRKPSFGNCVVLDSSGPADSNWMKSDCGSNNFFICQL
ncbi:CD209 antigen-like protein E [Corythoichthys intestinalis]|uniref:CD209 antigen-like protein E n=1 Tax=Corythoichthys intestinalis TaxID=161448 RepID=UPI0025A63F23|nr:CD209 antigen-like protein E [Corythoichthys intestinalis]